MTNAKVYVLYLIERPNVRNSSFDDQEMECLSCVQFQSHFLGREACEAVQLCSAEHLSAILAYPVNWKLKWVSEK
jgi:hypothetical protein